MAGVSSCMKYLMFIFNFLFWLCGSIILGVSIWIRVGKDVQQKLDIDSSLFAGVDLLIAVGSIIMILGFLGCCGAIRESGCMLLLFFIGLLLILILQVTGGILGAVYRSQIETSLNQTLLESVNLLQGSTQEAKAFQEDFQKFQQMEHGRWTLSASLVLSITQRMPLNLTDIIDGNHCCGLLKGAADWGTNFNNEKICMCDLKDPPADVCIYEQNRYIYKKSCGDVVAKYLKDHLLIILGIAFGLAVIEILGLGFSMSLYCQIQRK